MLFYRQKKSIALSLSAFTALVIFVSSLASANADDAALKELGIVVDDAGGVGVVMLRREDAGGLTALEVDSVAVIELDANVTTGFNWQAPDDAGDRIRILGRRYVSPESDLLGAPGKTRIYVVGEAEGSADLELRYKRPFETAVEERITFHFQSMGRHEGDIELAPEKLLGSSQGKLRGDPESTLPDEFNWCDEGGCTPPKDQGNCGSCWAFGTIGPFENLIKIRDGVEEDLSEQYLVSCANDYDGCMGGSIGFNYLIDKSDDGGDAGVPLEETFPYVADDAACSGPYAKAYNALAWGFVGDSVEEIKQAIFDHGPLYVDVCANDAMSGYTSGIFTQGCGQSNHAVVLVGWNEPEGYWHMRNSWGANWGESGYMRIGYGVSNIASIAAWIDYDSRVGYSVEPRTPRSFVGLHCGSYTPESIVYTMVNNNQEQALDFEIVTDTDWLVATPASGTIEVGGSVDIEVAPTEEASTLSVGVYEAKVAFKNPTNGMGETTRYVSLTVEKGGEMIYSWNFDEDPGWTAEGLWGFGTPTGGGGSTGNTDPTGGYTGDNVYGLNLNGDYNNNMGQQLLTTTAIDFSGLTNTSLRFWRWLGVEQAPYDHAYIRVSTDQTTWQTVWQNTDMVSDGEWVHVSYDISPYADGQPAVYIRWILGVTDMGLTMCGWNIDDVEVWEDKEEPECGAEEEIDAGADTDTDTETDTGIDTDTTTDTGTDTAGDPAADEGDDGCGCGQAGASSETFNLLGNLVSLFIG